ncbi:MAG: Integrase [Candidatus Nitrotoga sp. SPKER]|nr:MAG: Integrase [Candidatus Nitrotoga sp. SPKER]
MAQQIGKLAARQVDSLKEGFHADGGNLYLRVKESGARSWVFRYKIAGKVSEFGLGSKNERSLADARALAGAMRKAIVDGNDPAELLNRRDSTAKTFQDYAAKLIEAMRPSWKSPGHTKEWETTLRRFAFPVIGFKLPSEVTLTDLEKILWPLWTTKTVTASRLRQRIEAVLAKAAVTERAPTRYNPAAWKNNLDQIFPKPNKVAKKVHFASAPYVDVPALMSALRSKNHMSAYCLRFIILTGARSGEARGALWSEIDMPAKTWTIPASRMKAGLGHRVPLNEEALIILAKMQDWRMPGSERVFPGRQGGLLCDVAVNQTLHNIITGVTVHGFRASFRMWGAETTAYPSAVLEAALAHVNQNATEAAYQRSDLFERRRELMNAWGNYCSSKGNIVQLVSNAAA